MARQLVIGGSPHRARTISFFSSRMTTVLMLDEAVWAVLEIAVSNRVELAIVLPDVDAVDDGDEQTSFLALHVGFDGERTMMLGLASSMFVPADDGCVEWYTTDRVEAMKAMEKEGERE